MVSHWHKGTPFFQKLHLLKAFHPYMIIYSLSYYS